MQIKTRNRLTGIIVVLLICASGVYFILSSLNDNIVFFHPPSEIDKIQPNHSKVRVGGLVKVGSIAKHENGKIEFTITDHIADLKIEYKGILPALFREKQGIVAEGRLITSNLFKAKKLLAKHDENYTPPELAKRNLNEKKKETNSYE
ncbi:MAG: cytochrome c maturation protein CcmE [Pseudomonadota bacterium]